MGGWAGVKGRQSRLPVWLLTVPPNRSHCAAAECETGRRVQSHRQLRTKGRRLESLCTDIEVCACVCLWARDRFLWELDECRGVNFEIFSIHVLFVFFHVSQRLCQQRSFQGLAIFFSHLSNPSRHACTQHERTDSCAQWNKTLPCAVTWKRHQKDTA